MARAENAPLMPRDGKPAHIEVFDGAGRSAGEIWAAPAAAATEIISEPSLAQRLGHASLELTRGVHNIGKVIAQRRFGEMLTEALRRSF